MVKYFMLIREKDQFEALARRDLLNRLIDGIEYEAEVHWVKLLAECVGDDYVQHLAKMLEDNRSLEVKTTGILTTTLIHVNDCPVWVADITKAFHTFLSPALSKLTQNFVTHYAAQYKNRTVTFLAAIVCQC